MKHMNALSIHKLLGIGIRSIGMKRSDPSCNHKYQKKARPFYKYEYEKAKTSVCTRKGCGLMMYYVMY